MTLNEKSLLKMYNSVIECVKVSNMFIGLIKTCLGLFERCDSIEDIERGIKSNKNHYNDSYSCFSIIRDCTALSFALNYLTNMVPAPTAYSIINNKVKTQPEKCIKKRRRSNVVEILREISDSVWVSFEAVIIEKTIKEE